MTNLAIQDYRIERISSRLNDDMQSSSEKFIIAERKNRFEENRLNVKLKQYDRSMVLCRYNVDTEKRTVSSQIGETKRTSGASKYGIPPTGPGDNVYEKSMHSRVSIRLSDKRLNEWKICEKDLNKFLLLNSNELTRKKPRPPRPPSTHYSFITRSESRMSQSVKTDIMKPNQSPDFKIRPHTAAFTKRKKSGSKRVEYPKRPATACPKQTSRDDAYLQTDRQDKSMLESKSSVQFLSGRSSPECTVKKDDWIASRHKMVDKVDKDDDHLQNKSPLKIQVGETKWNYPGLSEETSYSSISSLTKTTVEEQSSSKCMLKFQDPPKRQQFMKKQILRPDYVIQTIESVIRDAMVFSKTARKMALKNMVDQNSPDRREIILHSRLKKAKSEQNMLANCTREFCLRLDRDFKYQQPWQDI